MLEKTLESPLDCKENQPVHPKGDQSWVFIGKTDAKAETPILWPRMQRVDSFEKTLMLGKIEGRRRKGWQRMRWLDGITDSMDMSLGNSGSWWWTGRPGVLRFMGSQRVVHDWTTELKHNVSLIIYWIYIWLQIQLEFWNPIEGWGKEPKYLHVIEYENLRAGENLRKTLYFFFSHFIQKRLTLLKLKSIVIIKDSPNV